MLTEQWQSFEKALSKKDISLKQLLFYNGLFFLLFLTEIGGPFSRRSSYSLIFPIVMYIFWFKANGLVLRLKIKPLLLLILFVLAAFFQRLLLDVLNLPQNSTELISYPLRLVFQILWFVMAWTMGLLVVGQTRKKRQRILIYAFLLLYFSHNLLFFSHPLNRWIFYLIVFSALIKRTNWLENLSRAELGVYLLVFSVILVQYQAPDYFERAHSLAENARLGLWTYSLPFFLHYVGKIYFIILIIRIPVVLIYNYAAISRKLWISSLFQSTIPQIVQFSLLMFIFFLFISGWQAQSLRQEIYDLCQHKGDSAQTIQKISRKELAENFGQPQILKKDLGVAFVKESNSRQKVLYFHANQLNADSLYVLPLDTLFLRELFRRTRLIVGSGLIAYQLKPNAFLSYLYKIRFWQSEAIRINPLGLLNPFFKKGQTERALIYDGHGRGEAVKMSALPIVVGRVLFPLENDNAYFVIDIYYNLSDLLEWNFMTQVLLVLIIVFFVLNSLLIRRMIKFGSHINLLIVDRFAQLRKGVLAIARGNLDYHVSVKGDDEFAEFARHFNRMSRELKRFMRQAREKERLDQELKIAHQVQQKMLPEKLPQIPGYELAADLTTAHEVGGDFFDAFALDDRRYLFVIGDVSGKGMSAAFYMAQLMSLLRYSVRLISDLKELVIQLNDFLINEILDANIFVTLTVGILDCKTNRFEFVRAGHTLPVLMSFQNAKPEIRELETKGMGLGMTRSRQILEKNLEKGSIDLQAGDVVILYTDGFTEAAKNESGGSQAKVVYGEKHFKEVLLKCSQLNPAEMIDCLKNDLEQFYAGSQHFDDQTILIVKRKAN